MALEEDPDGKWLRVGLPPDATVEIGAGTEPVHDGYDWVTFPVTIAGPGLRASAAVGSVEGPGQPGLRSFLRRLAEDWRGVEAGPRWSAIEQGLTIDVKREPGYAVLQFALGENIDADAWVVRATVRIEAGEEMERLAAAADRLLWRPRVTQGDTQGLGT